MRKIVVPSLLGLLTLSASFGWKATAQQTLPTVNKAPLTKSIETEPLSVATLEEESNQLPESLKLASNRPVKADEATTAPIDALVISRQTLLGLKDNAALKDKLRNVVAQGKILMIQNATNLEMEQGLGIEVPVRLETDQDILFSGVTKLANGQYLGSAILSPPKEIEGALEPSNVARTVRNEIHAMRKQVREANRAGRLKASTWGNYQNFRTSWNLCPYGYFIETSRTRQTLGDGDVNRDYWTTELEQQTSSGISACGTTYQVDELSTIADVGFYNYNPTLVRYGPTTTNGAASATVTVGNSGLEFSYSYPVPDVAVIDQTSYPNFTASWIHNYNLGSNAARGVFYSTPGLTARNLQGYDYAIYRNITITLDDNYFVGSQPQKVFRTNWKLAHVNYN